LEVSEGSWQLEIITYTITCFLVIGMLIGKHTKMFVSSQPVWTQQARQSKYNLQQN